MEENPSKFKVIDRRRFDSEGNEKEILDISQNQTSEAKENGTNSRVENQASSEKDRIVNEQKHYEEENLSVSFSTLVLSLAQQALIHLGEATGVPGAPIDLEAARNTIDVLDVLKHKTKGNLTPEENELIQNITSTLKLKYVDVMGRFQSKKT